MLGRKGLPGARRDGGRRGAAPGWRHCLITLIRFNFIAARKNAALFYSSPTVHYYFFVYFLCISECLLCGCVQFGVVFFFPSLHKSGPEPCSAKGSSAAFLDAFQCGGILVLTRSSLFLEAGTLKLQLFIFGCATQAKCSLKW